MARGPRARTAPDTVLVIDKAAGMTSHDVVARVRRIVGSRKVGHAGTLDPMATGVLVLGVERATRLLGHLTKDDKEYEATIRLGASTVTDDAEGETVATVDASAVADEQVHRGVRALTGRLQQVPSAVSAVKIHGVRSYRRVRAGEQPDLPARPVTVSQFAVRDIARGRAPGVVDVEVTVVCSAGTYVRALARDLGEALGVGGHLTTLRRTRAGAFSLADALTLEQLQDTWPAAGVPLLAAVRAQFGVLTVDADHAIRVRHGAAVGISAVSGPLPARGPVGLASGDELLSLAEVRDGKLHPLAVLA